MIGTVTFPNGDRYMGEMKDNSIYGEGIYRFANGDRYVGTIWDGKRHGFGVFTSNKTSMLVSGRMTKIMGRACNLC